MLLQSWRTNSRVTAYVVEQLPRALWDMAIPGGPRRTVRMVAAHMHNVRCGWIKSLGQPHGIPVPAQVDRRQVTRRELLAALRRSARGIEALLELGLASGGHVPATKTYVWRTLPLDVAHVLTYFVAHEGHHRGQIVLVARQVGHPFPPDALEKLWQWNKWERETTPSAVPTSTTRRR